MKSVSLLIAAVASASMITACSSRHDRRADTKKDQKVETLNNKILGAFNSACVKTGSQMIPSSRTQLTFDSEGVATFAKQAFSNDSCAGTPDSITSVENFFYELSSVEENQAQLQLSELTEKEAGRKGDEHYVKAGGKRVQAFTVKIEDNKLNLIGLLPEGDTTPTEYFR